MGGGMSIDVTDKEGIHSFGGTFEISKPFNFELFMDRVESVINSKVCKTFLYEIRFVRLSFCPIPCLLRVV
jgi:hypothetical protein